MANNISAFSPEYRSARAQRLLKKMLVCREISNMEERSTLRNGIKVHRPYYSDIIVNDYTKGTEVTAQDITATDEYLTVDQTKEATVYIDEIDVMQNKYDTANLYIDRISYALKKDIDGAFLGEVANMTYTVDDGTFGGTSGNGYAVTVANVFKLFTTVEAEMNTANIEDTKSWFAVITPKVKALLQQTNLANGFNQADAALKGQLKGMGFHGTWGNFNIFVSNNVKHTYTFTTTAILVDTDIVTIGWVAFTADADGAATGAGHFSIQAAEDDCMDTLVTAINGTGTPGVDTYIALSTANRNILTNAKVAATYASHVLTITSQGYLSTSYTAAGTIYGTWATPVSSCRFGQYGCTDLVIQGDVKVQKNKEPLLTGYEYLAYTVYGKKTFVEWANRGVKVDLLAA